MKVFHFGKKV